MRACKGGRNIVLASPYMKSAILARILSVVDGSTAITCVTRWNPQDIAAGVSDTECRTIVKGRGGSFLLHPTLHAKFYRIDDAVLVGSANVTASAMGWGERPNLEILTRASDEFDADAFEHVLLKDARDVSDAESEYWAAITRIRPTDMEVGQSAPTEPDPWRPATRDLKHLTLAYLGRVDDIASQDERRLAARDLKAMNVPPDLTVEQLESWATTCLLAAPFACSVLALRREDSIEAVRTLAKLYDLTGASARRDMETVNNWLSVLAPDLLPGAD